MPETHSRAGKRVERTLVTDKPHDRYRFYHPQTGEKLKHGIPVLQSTRKGAVVDKNVTHNLIKCPQCNCPARFTEKSEPVCPECGIICGGEDVIISERLVRDSIAAERTAGVTENENQ